MSTKEIVKTKQSYKSQLAVHQQQAFDYCLRSCQLKRQLEESKRESAQLFHRLGDIEKENEAQRKLDFSLIDLFSLLKT